MKITNKFNMLARISLVTLIVGGMSLLTACGGGGSSSSDDPDPVAANPNGYYTGSASVKQGDNSTDFEITDLQVFVNGTRIMAMSVDNVLLYDITITDITGNDFTGSVTVYEDGAQLDTTTITGSISEGTSITGTFAGAGVVNGSFTVTYDTDINAVASVTEASPVTGWSGGFNVSNSEFAQFSFDINDSGSIWQSAVYFSTDHLVFLGCELTIDNSSTIIAIANQALYNITFVMQNCDTPALDGTYTGLGVIRDAETVPSGLFSIAFSNSGYAGTADFEL